MITTQHQIKELKAILKECDMSKTDKILNRLKAARMDHRKKVIHSLIEKLKADLEYQKNVNELRGFLNDENTEGLIK